MTIRVAIPWSLIALAIACRKPPPADELEEKPYASASPSVDKSAAPVDHLAPDELLEGSQRAFGVVLPRALTVNGSFVDVVYARGPASVHALVQYFRSRLQGGGLREGPTAATFEHVNLQGTPGLELLVHIVAAPEGASVEIRNSTPPPAPVLPDEPSRWRKVGLTPQGRLAETGRLE